MPPRIPPAPMQPRRLATPKQRRAVQQQRMIAAPPKSQTTTAVNVPRQSAPLSTATATPAIESPLQRAAAVPAVTALTIARWAKPATLRQQFILTEIFQPPLALRDPR